MCVCVCVFHGLLSLTRLWARQEMLSALVEKRDRKQELAQAQAPVKRPAEKPMETRGNAKAGSKAGAGGQKSLKEMLKNPAAFETKGTQI